MASALQGCQPQQLPFLWFYSFMSWLQLYRVANPNTMFAWTEWHLNTTPYCPVLKWGLKWHLKFSIQVQKFPKWHLNWSSPEKRLIVCRLVFRCSLCYQSIAYITWKPSVVYFELLSGAVHNTIICSLCLFPFFFSLSFSFSHLLFLSRKTSLLFETFNR